MSWKREGGKEAKGRVKKQNKTPILEKRKVKRYS